ncbi:MAG: YebC/PmpR family DNA-binding transcriptional regulator [Clostridia bacterium]|nr:YebC/PmpR family DNA-binding transcriptional regulator [Clostridia bacterium]
MSGHSKWANIKRKKGAADAARAKVFTRIGKEIQIAVRDGGPNPDNNSKLKDVIAKAKANNMPNDNIQRSIKKAAGEGGGENIEEIRYEGYGPGGVAIMVDVVTDNRNRTASEVRHVFDKHGGNLGNNGCVAFMFDRKGVILIENDGDIDEETLMMDVLEAGGEDFNPTEEVFEITTDPASFSAVSEALEAKGYVLAEAEIKMVPQTTTHLGDEKQIEQIGKLLDGLDENDDVIDVFHSWDEEE